MKQFIKNWILHRAKWWMFWYPQTGIIGGAFIGFVLAGVLLWLAM